LNLETGERYVGSTNHFARRKRQHLSDLKLGKNGNPNLQNAYNQYGKSAFEFSLLEVTEADFDVLISREQYWMDYLHPEYNINPRAGFCVGDYVHNEKAHKKISVIMKEMWKDPEYKANWMEKMKDKRHLLCKGRKLSDATKEKLRQANLGKNNPNYGKPRSQAFLDKMQKTYSGAVSPDGVVYAPITGLNTFCKEHNLDCGSMSRVMSGKYKHHKGWTRYSPNILDRHP